MDIMSQADKLNFVIQQLDLHIVFMVVLMKAVICICACWSRDCLLCFITRVLFEVL